jgi:hypothetical protein
MRSNGKASGIVRRDSREDLKRRIFQNLNEQVTSNDIAVIYGLYELARRRDPSISVQDDWRYQSRGPTGTPGFCLFCGWGMSKPKDFVHMGKFDADPWCYYDFREQIGVCYLESAGYRPPVIIVPIHFPGSIDNAILDLAWGLARHFNPVGLNTRTTKKAAKLVKKMEMKLASSSEIRRIAPVAIRPYSAGSAPNLGVGRVRNP